MRRKPPPAAAELNPESPDPLEGIDLDAALAPNEGGSSAGRAETPCRKRRK